MEDGQRRELEHCVPCSGDLYGKNMLRNVHKAILN